jgi:hypothetical protein
LHIFSPPDSVFPGVFVAEEVGLGHKGSGDTTMIDIHTFLVAFLSMALQYACFSDAAFLLVKSKTSSLWTTLL